MYWNLKKRQFEEEKKISLKNYARREQMEIAQDTSQASHLLSTTISDITRIHTPSDILKVLTEFINKHNKLHLDNLEMARNEFFQLSDGRTLSHGIKFTNIKQIPTRKKKLPKAKLKIHDCL